MTGRFLLCAALLCSCAGTYKPMPMEPEPVAGSVGPPPAERKRRVEEVFVGQMCLAEAAGRPAVRGLWQGTRRWRPSTGGRLLATRSVRALQVLGWDGHKAGLFGVAGASRKGNVEFGVGSYTGRSPCADRAATENEQLIPECVTALGLCGLAVANIEPAGGFYSRPFEEDPELKALATSGACANSGMLSVDLDGDGSAEVFPIAKFFSARGFNKEVVAKKNSGNCAEPHFAIADLVPKTMHLLAVLDLNGDGRQEVILGLEQNGKREWGLFQTAGSVARLELVGRANVWR